MIYKIIQELAATSSRLEKEAILEKNKDNELLKRFFFLTLDPFTQFYQRKIPTYKTSDNPKVDLGYGMNSLTELSTRVFTGHAAIKYLADLLSDMEPDDAKVIELIIKKDPKCGVAESTVNKIWEKLIPEYPVLLASPYSQKLMEKFNWDEGVIAQVKSDGMRVNIIINNGVVEVRSRNGKLVELNGHFDNLIEDFNGTVIDGELLVRDKDGKILDRKTGNGICNKSIKGTISDEEIAGIFISAWDIIPYENFKQVKPDTTQYESRFDTLQYLVSLNRPENVRIIESKIVYSQEEAQVLYRSFVARGEEGAIIKSRKMIWDNTRSKDQVKMKELLSFDLLCVGIERGKEGTRNADRTGALVLETGCGKLRVNVGSMPDDLRDKFWQDPPIGKIIEGEYNQLITNKKGEYSLFLPVFVSVREDKSVSNTLQYFIDQQSA